MAAASVVAATAVPATYRRKIITLHGNYQAVINLISVQQSTNESPIFFDEFINIWKRAYFLWCARNYLMIHYHKAAEPDQDAYGIESK